MKKKFIAVYALLGVMALGSTTLTSCVDDNESASVTAIRDAKAEQLKALAAYSNAQAALQQAMADAKNIENDKNKQTLEAEVAKLKAQAEEARLEAEKQIALAEQQIVKDKQDYIGKLFQNYKNAQDDVNDLTGEIIDMNLLLAQYEADVVSAKALAQANIQTSRKKIVAAEAEKAIYETMAGNNYDELVAEAAQLDIQVDEKKKAKTIKSTEKNQAQEAFDNAKIPFEGRKVTDSESGSTTIAPTLKTGIAIKALEKMLTDSKITTSVLDDSEKQYATEGDPTSTSITVYSLKQSAVTSETNTLEQNVKNTQTTLGEASDKSTGTSVYAQYNAKKEAYEKALDAYTKDSDNDALKQTMVSAKSAMEKFEEDDLKPAQKAADDAQKDLDEFNAAVAAFSGTDYKAYTDAITAVLNKEGKALDEATKAEYTAIAELYKVEKELEAVEDLRDNTIDIENAIAQCEKTIAEETAKIKEYETMDADASVEGGASAQAIYDTAKAELEDMEANLETAEKIAAGCKADLEAAINGSSSTETPAE